MENHLNDIKTIKMEENMPTKILVVDDEPDMQHLIPQQFRKEIRQQKFEFHFANNGKEALEILEQNETIDLILLDINMQVMDGLTFLAEIKEKKVPLIRAIIISAFGHMQNIRTAMNLGAYDFVVKPIDFRDLKITIEKYLKDQEFLKKALLEHDELVSYKKELEIAEEIQCAVLPKNFPNLSGREELDLHAQMISAKKVGGDLYDFFFLDKHRLGIVVGDVSGKGVPAAIFMPFSKNMINNTALKGMPTDTCLEILNKELFKISSNTIQVTIFYGILDTRDGSFEYCSGGHLPPYLVSTGGKVTKLENKGGFPIGMFETTDYEFNRITLKPGDIIFVYTDGITEAREKGNKEAEEFGEERLKNCLLHVHNLSMKEVTSRVIDEVKAFTQGKGWDDITCLALRYRGKPIKEQS
jgi:sigma-B regulation protein RsbU (phosphoserine phosphatase)